MAKYQNLLDIMAQLLAEHSEPMCRQTAGVFQRFVPEAGVDLQNMINNYKYGPATAALDSGEATGSELVLTEQYFNKKKSQGVVATSKPQDEPILQKSSQPSPVHTNAAKPEPVVEVKLPTEKLADLEAMQKHFTGMSLKQIREFMNDNGIKILGTAKAPEVLEVLNASIK